MDKNSDENDINGDKADKFMENKHQLDFKEYKSRLKLNENLGRHSKALICIFQFMKQVIDSDIENKAEVLKDCRNSIEVNATHLFEFSDELKNEELFGFLYELGKKFATQSHHLLAEYSLQTANLLNPDDDNDLDVLYQLSLAQKAQNKNDASTANLKKCYEIGLQRNDILFQAKILYEMFTTFYLQHLYEEAIASSIQMFILKSDLEENLQESLPYFAAILPEGAGGEKDIHVKIADAYQQLGLYDNALVHNNKYEELVKSEIGQKPDCHYSLDGLRQIYKVNAKLLTSMNRNQEAINVLTKWQHLLQQKKNLQSDFNDEERRLIDFMTSYQMIFKSLSLMKDDVISSDVDEMLVRMWLKEMDEIVNSLKDERTRADFILLQISTYNKFASVAKFHTNIEKLTEDLRQMIAKFPVDITMMYEARMFVMKADKLKTKGKYLEAYTTYDEAVTIATKCGRILGDEIEEIQNKIGLCTQHLSSEKELSIGMKILVKTLLRIESKLYIYRQQGVIHYYEDTKLLTKCYKALQVILHRLDKYKLSTITNECFNRRSTLTSQGLKVQFPVELLRESGADNKNASDSVDLCENNEVFDQDSSVVFLYTQHEKGFLAQLVNLTSADCETTSYLLSENIQNVEKMMKKLQKLVSITAHYNGTPSSDELYNTENRNIQLNPSSSLNYDVTRKSVITNEASGDVVDNDQEQHTREEALQELSTILLQPFYNHLNKLKPNSSVKFVTSDMLFSLIPYDELRFGTSNKTLGSMFHISISPNYLLVKERKLETQENTVKEPIDLRSDELEKIYNKIELDTLQQIGLDKTIGSLVIKSASNAPIITSNQFVTRQKQMEAGYGACVIGSPSSEMTLQLEEGRNWKIPKSPHAYQECETIAEYMNVTAITGISATKDHFIEELKQNSVVHIATFGCFKQGILIMSPNHYPTPISKIPSTSFMITSHDITSLQLRHIKLLVMSSCYKWNQVHNNDVINMPIVRSFLNAGVQCIVIPKWPVPDQVSTTFYQIFYKHLQCISTISEAIYQTKIQMKSKYPSNPNYFNCFTLIGRGNVTVDLTSMRKTQLQQILSESEEKVLRHQVDKKQEILDETEIFHMLQTYISQMSASMDTSTKLVDFLIGLIVEATQRLAHDDLMNRPVVMVPNMVVDTNGCMKMLRLVGFDFQSVGAQQHHLAVVNQKNSSRLMFVFPHWNQDQLLLPLHRALTGFQELCTNPECILSLSKMLPLEQHQLEALIDLLAVTKHNPSFQLRISDPSVHKVWKCFYMKRFLQSIGFISIKSLLLFKRSLPNRQLLIGSLQLLIAFCLNRDHGIMEKLDVTSLAQSNHVKDDDTTNESNELKSLQPLPMPSGDILITSSWMKDSTYKYESCDRKNLVDQISQVNYKYNKILQHVLWWHQHIKFPCAATTNTSPNNQSTTEVARVKMVAGSTPSCDRYQVGEIPPQKLNVELRKEADEILMKRCKIIKRRQEEEIKKCYLPFVKK